MPLAEESPCSEEITLIFWQSAATASRAAWRERDPLLEIRGASSRMSGEEEDDDASAPISASRARQQKKKKKKKM